MRDERETAVRGLLTIDVAAEVRKLADGALEGPWQAPAELVRRALADGAQHVDIALGRRDVYLRDDGRPLPAALLEALAAVLDGARGEAARHAGLIALESSGATGLLSVLSLEPARIVVETGDGSWGRRLSAARSGRPRIETRPVPAGTTIVLEGVALDRARAREALRALGRFAPAALRLDGVPIARGFGPTLAEAPLDPPLAGRVALLAGDDVARLWLLLDGVVSAHLALPTAPAFGAFVEMRSLISQPASAAALRQAVEPHLAAIVDQAVRLGLAAARSVADRPEPEQRQLRSFLLTAVQRRLRTAEVLRAAVFRVVGGAGRDGRWLSLLELGREADPERRLWAVGSSEESRALGSGRIPVLVLAADERGRLCELLGVSFRTPPPAAGASLLGRVRDAVASARAALARAARALVQLGGRAAIRDEALSSDERGFARALRAQLPVRGTKTVSFCAGRGPVGRTGATWWLPRANASVVAAVHAVACEPAWIYPAVLALLEGRALPTEAARERWTSLRRREGETSA